MLWLFLACAPGTDTSDKVDCPDSGDARLDLPTMCLDGVCPLATYGDAVAAWGESPDCYYSTMTSVCKWFDGFYWTFPDCDGDQEPDETDECDWSSQSMSIFDPFPGATADGLGLGVDSSCFESSLGAPSSTATVTTGGFDSTWDFTDSGVTLTAYFDDDGLSTQFIELWNTF